MYETWEKEYDDNIKTVKELARILEFSEEEEKKLEEVADHFPMSVSRHYFSLINWNDPEDPVRKMCIPSLKELNFDGSFDTSGEESNTAVPGLQHKYRETALILSTNQCAMYCRHCFRKRLVGLTEDEVGIHINKMTDYIRMHPDINNVLVSGGDMLMLSDERIEEYLSELSKLEQLDFIRLGTRIPVVMPNRIIKDQVLLEMLDSYNKKKQIYVITQFNHPNECTEEAKMAIRAIQKSGITVKNQTVLLRGVNDSVEVLGKLLRMISSWGIVAHYIFQCRPVSGVKRHFQVPVEEGYQIVSGANALQNGLGKAAEYTMSHVTGKIQILGELENGEMLFKYRQAKDIHRSGQIFSRKLEKNQCWLPDSF